MSSNKGGVTFVVIILLLVSVAFAYVLTSPTGGGLINPTTPAKYTKYVNLGADAAGWENNYNSSQRNPILNVTTSTLVYFNVTEMDGAPHNLLIAYDGAYSASLFSTYLGYLTGGSPTKAENPGASYQVLSESQITQTIGHSTQGKFNFQKAGIYTYWCAVHPTSMVGLLIVNDTTTSGSVATTHYSGENAGSTSGNDLTTTTLPFYSISPLALKDVNLVE